MLVHASVFPVGAWKLLVLDQSRDLLEGVRLGTSHSEHKASLRKTLSILAYPRPGSRLISALLITCRRSGF